MDRAVWHWNHRDFESGVIPLDGRFREFPGVVMFNKLVVGGGGGGVDKPNGKGIGV